MNVRIQERERQAVREDIERGMPEKSVFQTAVGREYRAAIREVVRSRAAEVVGMLDQASIRAVNKIESHIDSPNEEISLKASTYIVDHVIGKATQKSISRIENVNIDIVAD